ncbi:MAG: hypothetical protein KKG64_03060, partial [Firmicutes bacterium]|nr:hypothetical protein [Bacillota bacterium]
MMNREEQVNVKKPELNISITKNSREEILIDCYINWLQPNLNSPNFPLLSAEDITKHNARKEWDERLQKIQQEHNIDKESAIKLLNKNFGERPKNLISQEGWFLISDNKEKDVSNIHYSFGFEGNQYESFWVEIALNSVASVEQFLSMNEKEISKFFEMCKNKPPRMILELTKKTKTNYASSTSHETIIEKEMCNLSEQDIKMIRVKANEIRNIENPLIQPFIGLCVVRFVNKEELAELFSQME